MTVFLQKIFCSMVRYQCIVYVRQKQSSFINIISIVLVVLKLTKRVLCETRNASVRLLKNIFPWKLALLRRSVQIYCQIVERKRVRGRGILKQETKQNQTYKAARTTVSSFLPETIVNSQEFYKHTHAYIEYLRMGTYTR